MVSVVTNVHVYFLYDQSGGGGGGRGGAICVIEQGNPLRDNPLLLTDVDKLCRLER